MLVAQHHRLIHVIAVPAEIIVVRTQDRRNELAWYHRTEGQLVADRPEWIRLIDSRPDIRRSSRCENGVSNPFTKRPMIFKGNPYGAQVRVKSSVVGSIHCAMDGSRKLIVCFEVGANADVQHIAIDIATRLAWNFVTSDPA